MLYALFLFFMTFAFAVLDGRQLIAPTSETPADRCRELDYLSTEHISASLPIIERWRRELAPQHPNEPSKSSRK